ncbi:MAG: hypothetical protein SNJ76_00540 [Fimbriimonadaceae bacterium]
MNRSRRNQGTSLVELLVVIVVLLVGILGVVQVFPGGFSALRTTRSNSVATELARSQIEAVKSRPDQVPEMVLPVQYIFGSPTTVVADLGRRQDDLSLAGVGISAAGDVLDAGGNALAPWPFLSGANLYRRIVGEGGPVPAPRAVGSAFAGIMLLQFGPIVFNPNLDSLFQVYGNDLVKREGLPGGWRTFDYEVYLEDVGEPDAVIALPRDANRVRQYRLAMTCWISDGGQVFRRDIVDTTITVAPDPAGGFAQFPLASFAGLTGGESFVGAEWDTIRVARLFLRLDPDTDAFSADPYEYMLLDSRLGILAFNPAGYNFQEPRPRGRRIPLVARVNYDVFDWRIIRDEFRIPGNAPFQQKLLLNSLKVRGNQDVDRSTYQGIEVPLPDGNGGTLFSDVILVDVETGGVFLHDPTNPGNPSGPASTLNDYLNVDPTRSSFAVDKSIGMMRFLDFDQNPANGLQMRLFLPGATTPITVDASGRAVRALYRARGEWAVQVLKAPARFTQTFNAPNVGQYYVGQSPLASGTGPGAPTRIYFPGQDAGGKVTIGEIWYVDGGGNVRTILDQNFVIRSAPADPLGPYVDIREIDPSATAFDWSQGYSVRRVKGASLGVRVLWNDQSFTLGPDPVANADAFNTWSRMWRRNRVETFLQRGGN